MILNPVSWARFFEKKQINVRYFIYLNIKIQYGSEHSIKYSRSQATNGAIMIH